MNLKTLLLHLALNDNVGDISCTFDFDFGFISYENSGYEP